MTPNRSQPGRAPNKPDDIRNYEAGGMFAAIAAYFAIARAWALNVLDSQFRIQDNGDTTKQLAVEVSGIATGTTRTWTAPDASGTVVLDTATQTLTNKTVTDSTFTIQDNGDTTKKAQIEASGIATGTTRTMTVPDLSGTLALTTGAQTLSGKTLDDTNAITVKDASLVIEDDGDTSKKFKLQVSGVSASTTRTGTVPDADFTFVGTATTQTLTNKTLTTPALTSPTVTQNSASTVGVTITGTASSTVDQLVVDASATTNGQKTYVDKNGHLTSSQAAAPTIVAGTGAGTGPTVSVAGTDQAGQITVTTGTAPAGGFATIATVSFRNAYGRAINAVLLTPANTGAAGLNRNQDPLVSNGGITTTQFALFSNTALAASTTYVWYYHVL